MKCLVCGKEYEAAECPRCHFPDIQIVGDREKALESMMPTIQKYRMNFMRTVKISLDIYRWKDENGKVVLDRKEQKLFGTAEELMQGETWLDEKFARIPDQKDVEVSICIYMGDEENRVSIFLPNLQKAELQQIGVVIDNACNLRVLLRNDTEAPTSSNPVTLLTA